MATEFPQRVLIIDDEPHIRTYLRLILSDAGATDIKEAGDGANALLIYHHQSPELVLLDFNLPGVDGLAILERILALDPHARVDDGCRLARNGGKCVIHPQGYAPQPNSATLRAVWAEGAAD